MQVIVSFKTALLVIMLLSSFVPRRLVPSFFRHHLKSTYTSWIPQNSRQGTNYLSVVFLVVFSQLIFFLLLTYHALFSHLALYGGDHLATGKVLLPHARTSSKENSELQLHSSDITKSLQISGERQVSSLNLTLQI